MRFSLDIKQLLFRQQIGFNKKPIFKSQAQLVRDLLTTNYFQGRKDKSFAAYINQVLRPASVSTNRPLSDVLRDSILEVAESKLDDKYDFKSFVEAFDLGFRRLKNLDVQPFSSDRALDVFHEDIDRSMSQFIVTYAPAETKSNEGSNTLREQLLGHLGLFDEAYTEQKYRYVFCMNKLTTIKKFWLNLQETLTDSETMGGAGLSLDETTRRLITVNKSKKLQTFICDDAFCSIPYVLLNFDSAYREEVKGYVYFDKGDAPIGISIMSNESVNIKMMNDVEFIENGDYESFDPVDILT